MHYDLAYMPMPAQDRSRGVSIRAMRPDDWTAVRAIYEDGIATGHATFETAAPSWEEWDGDHLVSPRLVAELDGVIVGWSALSPTSRRAVYRGVAEVSVYVGAAHRGRGAGRALLGALIDGSDAEGIWTLRAGVFPENSASLALHRSLGFRVVGTHERVGRMGDRWRDVVVLERRSPVVD